MFDRVRTAARLRHYSRRTEAAYVAWIRQYIFFHGKRYPAEVGAAEVTRFLSSLAVEGRVAASTHAFSETRPPRDGGRRNSKSPLAAANAPPPAPLPRATIAPPEGEVKRPARAMPLGGAQKGGEPATPVPSLRSKPGAARVRTRAGGRRRRAVRSAWGRGNAENAGSCSVTLPAAAASATRPGRAMRLRARAARARHEGSRLWCAPPPSAAGRRSAGTERRPGRTPAAAAPPTTTSHQAYPTTRAPAPPAAPSPRFAPPPGVLQRQHRDAGE
ncbi:MAG: phage integrase N-terminal SAM-like domain-containing protein [Candidatus Eiseniibacteriota bacterium]